MDKTLTFDWKPDRFFRPTPAHLLIAILASLPLLALMSRTPASWWVQSGFETYPGTYVRMTSDNYGLCRPWREPTPGAHRSQGLHVTSRFGELSGAEESNFAALIPANAHVTAIYCASAPATSPLADCSVLRCPMPMHIQVEDSIFTLGRGVVFSFRNKAARPGQQTKVGFWIEWK